MATLKHRITISLDDEPYAVLSRLATLQKAPMSRIVSELFVEVSPVLARVADALAIAKQANDSVRVRLMQGAVDAEEQLKPLSKALLDQLDMFSAQMGDLGTQIDHESGGPQPVITGAKKVHENAQTLTEQGFSVRSVKTKKNVSKGAK